LNSATSFRAGYIDERFLDFYKIGLAEGRTIALVTHDPEIAAVTPRQIEIRDGRIAEEVDQTLAEPSLAAVTSNFPFRLNCAL
jgi:ABC-type siderophore export system fused ATPase/permease subunit